jgi:hypothetical protein
MSADERVKMDFVFALTLVHEVVHAFFWFPRMVGDGREPAHRLGEEFKELGLSWEMSVFGALLRLDDGGMPSTNPGKPLIAETIEERQNGPGGKHTQVPVGWVRKWFLGSTWDDFGALWKTELEASRFIG